MPIRIQCSTSACVNPLFSEKQKRRADNLVVAFGCVFACLDDPLFEATFLMSVVDEDPSQLKRSRCLVSALTRTFLDDVRLTRHWVVERRAAETIVFSTSTSRVVCHECTSKLSHSPTRAAMMTHKSLTAKSCIMRQRVSHESGIRAVLTSKTPAESHPCQSANLETQDLAGRKGCRARCPTDPLASASCTSGSCHQAL